MVCQAYSAHTSFIPIMWNCDKNTLQSLSYKKKGEEANSPLHSIVPYFGSGTLLPIDYNYNSY